MELTKEVIEKKIKELEQIRQNAIGNVNAMNGALQVLQDLIKEDKPKEPVIKEVK
jgi:hypothetical protein